MKFSDPLIKGRLIQRYKRFLADVELVNGDIITAHCANPGSMLGLKEPGLEIWLSKSSNPKRKLAYTWELAKLENCYVGINTNLPNQIVAEAITLGKIEPLVKFENLRREVRYGENSRIDILLEGSGIPATYVEVKNVHLMREFGLAEFPDAVTARGAKHLVELSKMVKGGHRAVMIYLIQYPVSQKFRIADDIDSVYATAFKSAINAGVEAFAYVCDINLSEICVRESVPIEFPN